MDKTININLAGTLFKIDEDAYKILRDYLQAIDLRFRNMKGGNETIEDLEARIAEIFNSQNGVAGVITKENVESMIAIMGKPEDFDAPEIQENMEDATYHRKRLYRNPDDTIIAGVCGGIGAYLNTDPVLLRILFVIFTAFFAFGLFAYVILWIALPSANNEARQREMYGSDYARIMAQKRQYAGSYSGNIPSYNKGYYQSSRLGNVLNEAFRAIGRVLFVIMRIFLIIAGSLLLLTGFLFLLMLILIFVFKIPGAFTSDAFNLNIVYFPDFISYLVSPSVYPWIIFLASLVILLPLLAIIYWGVKMIFWFKARDGVLSLILLIVWALSCTALALLLFNEGVSFAESSRSTTKIPLDNPPDTLVLTSDNKIDGMINDKSLPFSTDGYYLLMNEEKKELYISPEINIEAAGKESSGISVRKESFGNTEINAFNKIKEIEFNYRFSGDTIYTDDFFKIPASRRWSGDNIKVTITLPAGTTLKIDSYVEKLLDLNDNRDEDENQFPLERKEGYSIWKLTEDGLIPAGK